MESSIKVCCMFLPDFQSVHSACSSNLLDFNSFRIFYSFICTLPLPTSLISSSFDLSAARGQKGERRGFYEDPARMIWVQPAPWSCSFVLA